MSNKKTKKQPKQLPKDPRSEAGGLNLQFKLLSAIAITIIVAGHCFHGGINLGHDWFPPYSFNIALLVFISGYFYKDKYEDSVLKYIWKRTKRLLIPAYLWNIVYGLFILLMKNFGYTIGAEVNPYNLFLMPFVDGEAFVYNLGSWFVYPLFAVCVFNVLFRKLLRWIKLDNEYFIFLIYLTIGIIGINISIGLSTSGAGGTSDNNGILRLLTRSMFFLPCYQLGKLYKAKLEAKDNLNSIAYFGILFGVQLTLLTIFESSENLKYFPSAMSGFNNGPFVPYITALTGIAFWLRVSKLLTPAVRHWKPIRLVADNTYSIMIHQIIGYMSVKWIFALLSSTTDWFKDFNFDLMRTNVWYWYLPKGMEQYALLYLLGGILVPIGIKKLLDLVYKPIKNTIAKNTKKQAVN